MGILLLVDKKILSIPIDECHEELVDLKNTADLYYGPPECEEMVEHYTMIRKSVYDRLLKAQTLLPAGLKLRLYEGLRSIKVQALLFENEMAKVKVADPSLSDNLAHMEAVKMVSPVVNLDGTRNIPPHSTGAAVDIEIINTSGQVIDFGMEIKDWGQVSPELCLTENDRLSNEARANRQLLAKVMKAVGFINYPGEWWHWSYGDRYWAYHTGKAKAIYGTVAACQ